MNNSSKDQYPEVNISYRYDKNETNFIIHFAKRQIKKKQAKEIDDEIWSFEYGGRYLFYDAQDEAIFYPEQLHAVKSGIDQYRKDGYDIDEIDVFNIVTEYPDRFALAYDYYLNHLNKINSRILFM